MEEHNRFPWPRMGKGKGGVGRRRGRPGGRLGVLRRVAEVEREEERGGFGVIRFLIEELLRVVLKGLAKHRERERKKSHASDRIVPHAPCVLAFSFFAY